VESNQAAARLEALCAANPGASHPRLLTYANVSGKADLVFHVAGGGVGQIAQLHRDLEACFRAGNADAGVSVTSASLNCPNTCPLRKSTGRCSSNRKNCRPMARPSRPAWRELTKRRTEYEHYRLYPELPDWEVMGFYPMSKRRNAGDNWYSLDFAARKRLMGGHARRGPEICRRVSQLITGSTGLDEWEWGVTLMAHQVDALKEIVYEMRFDEVTARYGEFGPFYVNLASGPGGLVETSSSLRVAVEFFHFRPVYWIFCNQVILDLLLIRFKYCVKFESLYGDVM